MAKTMHWTVSVDIEVVGKLRQMAVKEERPLAWFVRKALTEYVSAYESGHSGEVKSKPRRVARRAKK